jgi:hypothetical protein
MKTTILSALSDTTRHSTIGREELAKICGILERKMRRIIADELPQVCECGHGYFLARCSEDYDMADMYLKSRISKLSERLAKRKQARLDLQHSPGLRSVSAMVKAWVVVNSNYEVVI